MNRIKPNLTGVCATSLLTVYDRDLDSRSPHPVLGDEKATEIVQSLDFDFSKFYAARKERYGVAVRTRQMDTTTKLQVRLASKHPAVRAAGTSLRWSLDDPRLLETYNPALTFAEEKNIIESPWLGQAARSYRATCAVMRRIPALRAQGGRILRYTF